MPLRSSPKTISLSFGILVLLFSLSFIAFAWTEPTLAPPSGNADAPLNVGTTAQTKNARLSVTELYDANDSAYYLNPNGQSVLSGPVGIGTTGPSEKLTVVGDVGLRDGTLWQPVYPSDDGLVLYSPFSEGTGTKVYDKSPYGNDGTISGSVAYTDGKYGNALNFTGGYIQVSDSPSFTTPTGFTVEAWIKPTSVSGTQGFVNKHTAGQNTDGSWVFGMNPGPGLAFGTFGAATTEFTKGYINGIDTATGVILEAGKWSHVVGVWKGTGLPDNSKPIGIGYYENNFSNNPSYFFNGIIDEVRVYNRALSVDEIRTQYLQGLQSQGYVKADNFKIINTSATELLRVTSGGNVGIGTSSPSTALDLNGALTVRAIAAPSVSPLTQGRIYFDSTANVFKVSENGGAYVNLVGGSSQWTTSGSNIYYNAGNVGIGTTSPGMKLDIFPGTGVETAFRIQSSGGVSDNFYIGQWGGTGSNWNLGGQNAGTMNLYINRNAAAGDVIIGATNGGTNSRVLMIQGSTGNVGIGTTNPTALLDVRGAVSGGTSRGINLIADTWPAWEGQGGNIVLEAGASGGTMQKIGGTISLRAGNGAPMAAGGAITITSGSGGTAAGTGGQLILNGGAGGDLWSGGGTGGALLLNGGVGGPGTPAGSGGPIIFQTAAGISLAEAMRIDKSGNVGIKTSSPSTALDLNGALTIRAIAAPSISPASQGRIYFDSTANVFKVSENGGAFVNLVGGSSQWTTSGSNIYYNTGNVGIGTTGPGSTLDVKGTFNVKDTFNVGSGFSATGGTITNSGIYTIHTFTTNGTFTVNGSGTVEYLVVAGGGGGTWASGGGGGAGGFRTGTNFSVTTQGYTVTVGAGGAGGTSSSAAVAGSPSTFSTISASGGGTQGNSGGSGGGGAEGSGTGGSGNSGGYSPPEGSSGGTGSGGAYSWAAGGGGGAGGSGGNASPKNGGIGGIGSQSSITGTATYYAGGGAGGAEDGPSKNGGLGGGGNSGTQGSAGSPGTPNTGGGGGGGSRNYGSGILGNGGAGGFGIVIIRYPTPLTFNYKKPIAVSNTGLAQTDYQVLVTIDTASLISAGKMQTDCDDIRFTDSDGSTLLNYWLESGCNTASTNLWVKIPSIPNGGKTIYVYYGNSSATSASDFESTRSTVSYSYDADSGVLAEWRFEEGSGTTASDTSGNGYNGTILEATYVNGKYGKALQFDGSNDKVSLPNASLTNGNTLTIEAWVNTSSGTKYQDMFDLADSQGPWMVTSGGNIAVDFFNGPGAQLTSPYSANNWYHVVLMGDNGAKKLFVNGALKGTNTDNVVSNISLNTGRIGNVDGDRAAEYWVGMIDDVRIYNRALSQKEITSDYLGRKYVSPEPIAGTPGAESSPSSTLFTSIAGNVGIGTTTPTSKLTVTGTIETTSGGIKFPDATIQTTAATAGGSIGEITLPLTNVFTMVNINDVETGKGVYADKTAKAGTVSGGDTWNWTALDANFSAIESQQPAEGSDSMYVLYKKTNGKFKYVKLDLKNKTLTSQVDEIPELWYDDAAYPNHNADAVYQYVTLTHDGNYMISTARSGNNGANQSNNYIVAEVRNKTTHASVKKSQTTFRTNRPDGSQWSFPRFYLGRNYVTDSWVHYAFGTRQSDDNNFWATSSWIQYASVKWDGTNLTFSAPGAGGGGGLWYAHDYRTDIQYSSKYPNEAMIFGYTNVWYNNVYNMGLFSRKVGDYANTVTTHYSSNPQSNTGVGTMTSLSVNGNVAGATFGYNIGNRQNASYTSFIFDEDFNVNTATAYNCSGGTNACTDSASVNLIPEGIFNGIYHTDSYNCNPACESAQTYSKREGKSIASGSGKKIKNEFMFASDQVNFKTSPSNLRINFGTTINYYDNRQTQWEWTIDTSTITSLSKAYTALGAALDKSYLYYNSQYYNNLSLSFDYYNGSSWVAGAEGSVDSLGFVPQKIRVNFDRGFSFNWPYLVFTYK